jgi:hypothetical protein
MLSYLVLTAGLAGLLVPMMVWACFSDRVDWTRNLAAPNWDFTRSWASNLTAAGTILTYSSLLACFAPTAVLPFGTRQGYLILVTIAGALAVLAPLAFNVLSRILQAFGKIFASSLAFLLSAGITVCGLSLQLLIGACMVWELRISGPLPVWLALALIVLVLSLLTSIVWYAILTASDVLKKEAPAAAQFEGIEAPSLPQQPKAWSLL